MRVLVSADMGRRWPASRIRAAVDALVEADDEEVCRLSQQQVFLLLPDTECGLEFRYLARQFCAHGQLELRADRFATIPLSGVGQSFEGYVLYRTTLFLALGLLRHTERSYHRQLRCALFQEKEEKCDVLSLNAQ